MTASKRSLAIVVLCIPFVVGLVRAFTAVAEKGPTSPAPSTPTGAALFGFAGSASCSGRACHGGDEPVKEGRVRQDEYTVSAMWDKHTRAYQALLGKQADDIAKNLAVLNKDGKKIPAHEDSRCLACHTTPEAAKDGTPDLATLNWQKAGVSCEACHGPAAKPGKEWATIHTSEAEWKKADKAAHGYRDLSNIRIAAETCVACHVGAPADTAKKIPARDCNHDIMAAGHPRLNFELATFAMNMPPHWDVEKKNVNVGELWAVGRVVSAKAALTLLADRTAHKNRWPELAEYRCYSCHTDLSNNWREFKNETGRSRGTLPYDSWYSTQLSNLNPKVKEGYAKLSAEMAKPIPDADMVKTIAQSLAKEHDDWLASKPSYKPEDLLKAATTGIDAVPRSWEDVTQLGLTIALLKKDAPKAPLDVVFKGTQFPAVKDGKAGGPAGIGGPVGDKKDVIDAFKTLLPSIK